MSSDAKVELIRSVVPLGLMHVEEELDREVTALAGRRHGSNPGTVRVAGQRVPIRVPLVREVAGPEMPLRTYAALHGDGEVNDRLLTAGDCASSYGWARIVVGEVTAALMAAFLVEVVRPGYRAAGWQRRRVLKDNGKEFKAGFVSSCAAHGVTHTRTKPRHAWTNGFVERLQGTILHEHWRVEFRRHYFTSARALQRSVDRFLAFYNRQRPHRGYRLRGRTPATIFRGAVAA